MIDLVAGSTKTIFARKRRGVVFESNPFKDKLQWQQLAADQNQQTLTSTLHLLLRQIDIQTRKVSVVGRHRIVQACHCEKLGRSSGLQGDAIHKAEHCRCEPTHRCQQSTARSRAKRSTRRLHKKHSESRSLRKAKPRDRRTALRLGKGEQERTAPERDPQDLREKTDRLHEE